MLAWSVLNLRRCKARFSSFLLLCLFTSSSFATFIETTIGPAVINDATATYFNAAALSLLKNPQIITMASAADFRTQFTGSVFQPQTGLTKIGSTRSTSRTYSPSIYIGLPVSRKVTLGLAMLSNAANRNEDDYSILRYVRGSNDIKDYDIVSGIAVKINEFFALGGGVNFSYLNLQLRPVTNFPGPNSVDTESRNDSDGSGVGANVGFLIKPASNILIGFNYRSATQYRLNGSSVFESSPPVISNNYRLKLWTPARSVLSMNYFVTPAVGVVTTLQRIQWRIFSNTHINGIAAVVGNQPAIVSATVPYYLHDSWLLTLGGHYRVTPKWIVRIAGTYNQSPGNSHYQITTGDSLVVGMSTGYIINKALTIDGSYAHAFIQGEDIAFANAKGAVNGVNRASRDGVTLKLTFNL